MNSRRLLRFAARCDVGPNREHNEDAIAVFDERGLRHSDDVFAATLPADEGVALLVLDGMGGHSSGDYACKQAREFLADKLACRWPMDEEARAGWLTELLLGASAHVNADNTRHAGQGATVALAVVVGEVVHVLHVGDVRVYLMRGDRLEPRTVDDTLVNCAREMGLVGVDLEQVPRNIIVQALGYGPPKPHVQTLRLEPGDGLLLCSDGLHGALADGEIAAALRGRAPAAACAALVELAIEANSGDNISALVARLE